MPALKILREIKEKGLEHIGLYLSSYRAIVLSNEDPNNTNRLKLLIPNLKSDGAWYYWAYPKGQIGGNNYGQHILPRKGDIVWVEFERGDTSLPIWSHYSYAREEKPEEFKTPRHYGFKTPSGNIIVINDNKGQEEILVKYTDQKKWLVINKDFLELESKLIKLGKEGDEWGVLGETCVKKIEELSDELNKLNDLFQQHTHSSGGQGPPQAPFITQANILKQAVITLKNTFKKMLSKKVKIDR